MGGGRHFHFPKHVWSPAGGWWANPTHWKRNTGFAFVGVGLAFIAIAKVSSEREVSEEFEADTGVDATAAAAACCYFDIAGGDSFFRVYIRRNAFGCHRPLLRGSLCR